MIGSNLENFLVKILPFILVIYVIHVLLRRLCLLYVHNTDKYYM